MIVLLQWATHDGSNSYYFHAPDGATLESFRSLCDRLMREAALDAIEGRPWRDLLEKPGDGEAINYNNLVCEVSQRLREHGYEPADIPTVRYLHWPDNSSRDSNASRMGDVHDRILEYNRDAYKRHAAMISEQISRSNKEKYHE